MILADRESKKPYLSAYVVREYCEHPSNFRCEGKLDDYLRENGVVGIYGVDTRELTKTVREAGVMNAVISSKPVTDLSQVRAYAITDAVMRCTCKRGARLWRRRRRPQDRIVGLRRQREHRPRAWCAAITASSACPPGTPPSRSSSCSRTASCSPTARATPAENVSIIENIRKLAGKLPIFGICLGHQLFALAMGGKTRKMKFGHRGANQPVKEFKTGTVYISSQNHGYEVLADSIKGVGLLSFVNANDNTCEGVEYPDLNAFTVQFHPEACAGPLDARDLFDKFMAMMDGGKTNA